MKIGVNLDNGSYWGMPWAQDHLLNRQHTLEARTGWGPGDTVRPVELNDDGWPDKIGHDETVDIKAIDEDFPAELVKPGRYIIAMEGRGAVDVRITERQYSGKHNAWQTVTPEQVAIFDIGNEGQLPVSVRLHHLREDGWADARIERLSLYREDGGQMGSFLPEFLEVLEPFEIIRTMEWTNTNNNPENISADRVTGNENQGVYEKDRGVACEYVRELAQVTGKTVWINIPHGAHDEYVEWIARQFDDIERVFVEYSNEVWNPMFMQHRFTRHQAVLDGQDWWQWQAKRVQRIKELWNQTVGHERHQHVLGVQNAVPSRTRNMLEWCDPDRIGIAPYFGEPLTQQWHKLRDKPPGEIVDMMYATMPWDDVAEHAAIAEAAGAPLACYEGGPHLRGTDAGSRQEQWDFVNNVIVPVNKHPRMGEVYLHMLRQLETQGVAEYCAWSLFDAPDPAGVNGIYGTPKLDAMLHFKADSGAGDAPDSATFDQLLEMLEDQRLKIKELRETNNAMNAAVKAMKEDRA